MLEFNEMNSKFVYFVVILGILLVFPACSSQAGNQNSSLSSPTSTTIEIHTPFPEGCRPERALLDNLAAQLPYDQRVIYYQTYAGEHTLVVWFVDPELGVEYTAENETKAVDKAVEAAQILASSSVCGEDFDMMHITVVAVDYTQWFSGSIRLEDIPSSGETSNGGGPDEERGAGISEVTAEPPALPGPNACAWQTVRTALDTEFNNLGLETEFYYIRDSNGSNVFVHWRTSQSREPLESIPLLVRVIEKIGCLFPEPTGISLTVAGQDGAVLLDGYLPGTQSGEETVFHLDDFSYQLLAP